MASLHLLFLLPFLFFLQQVNIIFKIVMSYTKLDLSKYRQDVEATCPPCPAPPVHACCGWMHCLYKLNFNLIFSYFYRSGDIMGTCCQVTLALTSIFASICSQSNRLFTFGKPESCPFSFVSFRHNCNMGNMQKRRLLQGRLTELTNLWIS